MIGLTKALKPLGAVLVIASLAGCASTEQKKAAEIETMTAQQLFEAGEKALDANPLRGDGTEYFAELERLYPYSEWAKRAIVMQAYSEHQRKNYEEARAASQRYLDLYPGGEDAAWAQYLLAISYYDQIDEVGRDQGLTFQALQAMRVVIEQYPDSEYAKSAMLKFELAFDHLAGKEMEIGRYYLRAGQYPAAVNRFRIVVEQFQTTTQTPEALHRLVEAYLALGLTQEAQTAGAILGHNFQGSQFYDDSFRLLSGRGLSPQAQGQSWLTAIYRQSIKGKWL